MGKPTFRLNDGRVVTMDLADMGPLAARLRADGFTMRLKRGWVYVYNPTGAKCMSFEPGAEAKAFAAGWSADA